MATRKARPVRLSYGTHNVFQRYWHGQGDPLYAVLSRRGDSVDWVTVKASPGELDRLCETAREARAGGDASERRVAAAFRKDNPQICRRR